LLEEQGVEERCVMTKQKPELPVLTIWHRAALDVLKTGPLSTEQIVQLVKERGAYQKPQTLRRIPRDLHLYRLVEKLPLKVADSEGRMTIQVWKLASAEIEAKE
jgi:hypothetical protein